MNNTPDTILITGGAGAIGSNLSKNLLDDGFKVVIIDDLSSGYLSNLDSRVSFFNSSILNNIFLKDVFSKYNFSHVFHLAAFFANQNSVENPQQDLMVNGIGIINLLELCKNNNVNKFIYVSSSCVYGDMQGAKESDLLLGDFDTPYAITKLLGEYYCKFFSQFHGLNTVIARLFNSYGPGEKPGKYRNVIPNFFQKAMNGESLVITGTGAETRCFNFVDDTVRGLKLLAFEETLPGEIFNIGNEKSISIKELALMINSITNNPKSLEFTFLRKWDHVLHRKANVEKIKDRFSYTPKIDLKEGLLLTYEWLKNLDD